jgi:hypothetical protein
MMKTIVWDVDDVLNNLMEAWLEEAWKPAHPRCDVPYAGIVKNPPHDILGISETEYLSSLDVFRHSEQARSMRPNTAILEWLQSFGDCYRHVALTARPLAATPPAAEWLFRHFGGYFRCFGVAPCRLDPTVPAYDRNKADFLAWFGGADYLVDDSPDNIEMVGSIGVQGILFPQPWNCGMRTVSDILHSLRDKVVVS